MFSEEWPAEITFRKHNNSDDDLPSPVLLDIHFRVAEILHACGRAENMERILRDRGSIACLAEDGSSDVASVIPLLLAL